MLVRTPRPRVKLPVRPLEIPQFSRSTVDPVRVQKQWNSAVRRVIKTAVPRPLQFAVWRSFHATSRTVAAEPKHFFRFYFNELNTNRVDKVAASPTLRTQSATSSTPSSNDEIPKASSTTSGVNNPENLESVDNEQLYKSSESRPSDSEEKSTENTANQQAHDVHRISKQYAAEALNELIVRACREAVKQTMSEVKSRSRLEESQSEGMSRGQSPKQPVWVAMKSSTLSIIGQIMWWVLAVIFIIIIFRQGATGPGMLLTTNYFPVENVTTSFDDVIGNEEAKEELRDIVEFLKDPDKFTRLGIKVPKGVLLEGPPGTGKTLIARALAGEAGVPFITTSGSEFEEMFVGVGARRVRTLFETARKKAPCIIFIDELDAVGSRRDDMHTRTKMTLNQMLVEMDGFSPSEGVIVIAATNMAQILDPALLRAGRFDRKVTVHLPDIKARKAMLDHFLKDKKVDSDVDTEVLARTCAGFSGADLSNLVNWAAIESAKRQMDKISMKLLDDAVLAVSLGRESKSRVLSEQAKKLTAYHESGHALVSLYTPGSKEIRKATLIPRGQALGFVYYLESDEPYTTKQEWQAMIDTSMGGRAAEELIFGPEKVTAGAANDIEQATKIAKHMVTKFGMSPEVGLVHVDENASPGTQALAEKEVKRIIDEGYQRAKKLLMEHETELHRLANALLKFETLEADEVRRVINGDDLSDKLEIMKREKEAEEARLKKKAERSDIPTREELLERARQSVNLPNTNVQPATQGASKS